MGEGGKSKYFIEKLLLEKEIVASDVWDIDKTKNNHFKVLTAGIIFIDKLL